MSLGGPEILVILIVALMLLGPDKLPSALKTAGKHLEILKNTRIWLKRKSIKPYL